MRIHNFILIALALVFALGASSFAASADAQKKDNHPSHESSKSSSQFKPIFDHNGSGGPLQWTELNKLDMLAIAACGDWMRKVPKSDVAKIFASPDAASYIDKIYTAVGKGVYGTPTSKANFVTDLVDFLSDTQSFNHVFCGAVGRREIGGLHWFARLQEMQEKKWGGLNSKCPKFSNDGPSQDLGIEYLNVKNNKIGQKCPLSFVRAQHADSLIIDMIKGYNQSKSSGKQVCFYEDALSDGHKVFYQVVRKKDKGLTTFYNKTDAHCDQPGKHCEMCA